MTEEERALLLELLSQEFSSGSKVQQRKRFCVMTVTVTILRKQIHVVVVSGNRLLSLPGLRLNGMAPTKITAQGFHMFDVTLDNSFRLTI